MNNVIGNNEHDRYVFVASEIVFQISYSDTIEGIFVAINGFLNDTQQGENNWRKRLDPPNADSRMVNFSSPAQPEGSQRFSLVPLRIIGREPEDLTPGDVLTILNDAYAELGGVFLGTEGNENQEVKGVDLGNGFRLISISPNWLASDLHHGATTGGPGSIPDTQSTPTEARRKFKLRGRQPPQVLQYKSPYSEEGIQVAILDTAIPLEAGINITTNNGVEHVEFPPGIKTILAGSPTDPDYPKMDVVLYPYPNELNEFDPYADWPHHYEMSDHGTFIASIIRALAPTVKIYLYEVLNRFGVGSLISIAEGIVNAVNQRSNDAIPVMVMNCSFMLENDLEDLNLVEEWEELKELLKPEIQELLNIAMRDVFNWVTTPELNVVVVAAAGNDANSTPSPRPFARYPAAFDRVLSVSALPRLPSRTPQPDPGNPLARGREYRTSTYSNSAHSENPNKDRAYSFATFGGELVPGSDSQDGGVLGVYIGGIPTQNVDGTLSPGLANSRGWARWSGTSFAAPIITALLAAQTSELVSDNPGVHLTLPRDLARPYRTVDDENVILVRQGT